jgi:hypothetical protein
MILLLIPGFNGVGPFASLEESLASDDAEVLGTVVTTVPGGGIAATTTIDRHVERIHYSVGDCTWYNQADGSVDTMDTKKVSCDEPHVFEVTGRYIVDLHEVPYPADSYWEAIFDSGPCLRFAEEYLGAKLDPYGNYYPTGVMPSPDSWPGGDREVWCGLAVHPYEAAALAAKGHMTTTGRVSAAKQHRLYPVGACLGSVGGGADEYYGVVPCDAPHRAEVVGHVDIRKRAREAPLGDEYPDLVGEDCFGLAEAYLGSAFRDPVDFLWDGIPPASWEAGRRHVTCMVAEFRNGEAITITRRLGQTVTS